MSEEHPLSGPLIDIGCGLLVIATAIIFLALAILGR
jgi:hypothetical protein